MRQVARSQADERLACSTVLGKKGQLVSLRSKASTAESYVLYILLLLKFDFLIFTSWKGGPPFDFSLLVGKTASGTAEPYNASNAQEIFNITKVVLLA